MNSTSKKAIITSVFCIAFTAPVLASNTTVVDSRFSSDSVTVSYADLNLNRSEGLKALHSRIENAAKRVCHLNEGTLSLKASIDRNQCFHETMEKAIDEIGIKNLVGMISN
jgi:UrcA family protein